jgi:hypothetical protein
MNLRDVPQHTSAVAALIYVGVVVAIYIASVRSGFFYKLRPYGFDQDAAANARWFALILLIFNGYLHVIERTGERVNVSWMIFGNMAIFLVCCGFYFYHLWHRKKKSPKPDEHRKNSFVVYLTPILYPALLEDHMSLYAEKYLVDLLELVGSRVFG